MRREASRFWLKPCLEFGFFFGDFFQELLDSSVPENCLRIRIQLEPGEPGAEVSEKKELYSQERLCL